MATLNASAKGKMKTTNKSGHAAYKLDDRTKLVTMALATMLGEPKYYGDNTDELLQLAESMCDSDGEFVAKTAVWARKYGNLRSVSHALMAVVAHKCSGQLDGDGKSFVRKAVRDIAQMRGDDGTEIMATGLAIYGDTFKRHNAVRRGIRDALEVAKPYSIAKYQSANKQVKLRDVLRLTHPAALNEGTVDAMGKCIAGELSVPMGWETELSARGNTKEVWDDLIHQGKVPFFAAVRNLRNMLKVGADVDPILKMISDPEAVKKSRLLPFRFYSAYVELARADLASTKVTRALDAALIAACENVDELPGKTAVLIDTSGSMGYKVSERSVTTCRDIAAVLGAMSSHISDDAMAIRFDSNASVLPMTGLSILGDMKSVPYAGGCTDMEAGFNCLLKSGFDADRVIVLSDNEVNGSCGWWRHDNKKAIQSKMDEYRKKLGHDVWCHAIDLQGYGSSQFLGKHTNIMAGWSESILRFISMAEQGFGGIVSDIDALTL